MTTDRIDFAEGVEPIAIRWDRTVIHPDIPSEDDTIICCTTMDDGRPVALFLDDEYREALGLQLVDPDADDGSNLYTREGAEWFDANDAQHTCPDSAPCPVIRHDTPTPGDDARLERYETAMRRSTQMTGVYSDPLYRKHAEAAVTVAAEEHRKLLCQVQQLRLANKVLSNDAADRAATIERVRAMHKPRTERHGAGCVQCGIVYPCPTSRALEAGQ